MRRRIVVYGATGLTGGLVARELAGTDGLLLAARRAGPLSALSQAVGAEHAVAQVDQLAGVLVPGDVLLSCAGPYGVIGEQVARVAIASGVTLLDVAGEPSYLHRLHAELGAPARAAGVTLLPAVGYEYLPGILLGCQVIEAAVGAARRVEIAYLAEGGLEAGSAGGRRSLLRAISRPTTTFAAGGLRREAVAARRSTFTAGGQRHATVSLGGLEVWALPQRYAELEAVDVHTGWFGALGAPLSLATRLAGPARRLALDRIADVVVDALGNGDHAALGRGTSRFVARARDSSGTVVARREAVAANAIVLAARLAAATAQEVAGADLRDLPGGVVDPVTALGMNTTARIAEWAGVVTTAG